MKKCYAIPMFFAILLLLASCHRSDADKTERKAAEFETLINSHTSGLIQSKSPIQANLAKSIERFQPGSTLPNDLFRFDPSIAGTAFLIDGHNIEFRPEHPLKNGQTYQVHFALDKVMDMPKNTETFHFQFSVINQDFNVFPGQLRFSDSLGEKTIAYEGKMISADDMTLEDAGKLLSASAPGTELKVSLNEINPSTFAYVIKNIPRKDQAYAITLSWKGKSVGVDKSGELAFEVPASNDFKLLQVEILQEGENQTIQLTFSDPIDPKQNLDGLIRFEGTEDFKIRTESNLVWLLPGQRLTGEVNIIIEKTLKNNQGSTLAARINYQLVMEPVKPEVVILGKGTILPDSRELILSFKSVSLKAVDVVVYKIYSDNLMQFFQNNNYDGDNELRYVARPVFRKMVRLDKNPDTDLQQWNAFSVDLTGMIKNDHRAMYRVKIAFRKAYANCDCETDNDADISKYEDLPVMEKDEQAYFDGDGYWYNDYPDDYRWSDRENPCTPSYYVPSRFPAHNILASNLGIIAKSADGRTFTVFVRNLLNTAAVTSAKVGFYNYQQQKIGEGTTDDQGVATINLDENPYLLLAKAGGQQSWLRMDDGSSLSLSNFDVAGQKIEKGIKGMIYGERGVWRPGDTLLITFVMDDISHKLPKELPAIFELYNARGQLVKREVQKNHTMGFYTFRPVTDPEAPTGNWTVKVQVGGASFEKRLKVETIKPNRLKMQLDFGNELLSKSNKNQKGYLDVKWMHGADAANLRAQINLKLYPGKRTFEGHEDFVFFDPSIDYYPSEQTVFDGKLDSSGKAIIPLNIEANNYAPGMLKAVFTTRAFEQGGDFSTDVFSIPFAPYDNFVGLRTPQKADEMLSTDTSHRIELMTLDKDGKPVSIENLEVRIYKFTRYWWWSSGEDNQAFWNQNQMMDLVETKSTSIKNGKGSFTFRINYPEWGRYFVQVSDPKGGHSSGQTIFVDWPSYISKSDRKNPQGAAVLKIASDKDTYHPGEQVKLTFPCPPQSRALISIETSSGILKHWWTEKEDIENGVSFEITSEMAPNVYAFVTLIQDHAQTLNDLPIRMYGVVPIMVEDPETKLYPVIVAPEEVRPMTDYTIAVSEKNGRMMTYTLAVVDEGLLDLTRFKTPDLWSNFYAREALGIKTWDLYDDVLGAYGAKLQKVLAIGGDDEIKVDSDKKAKRFEPVVKFLGPFTLNKNQKAKHTITMPNYVGSVRVMVVAGHEGAYGNAEENITVKQPLMLLPTAPRTISLMDEFDLPLTVFAMSEKIGKVDVKIKVEGSVSIVGESNQTISFDKPGEKMAYFKLKATANEGIAKIKIRASAGNETASASIELDVRNPNPFISNTNTQVLTAGETANIDYEFFGSKGSNSGLVEICTLPAFDLDKNLKYLIHYPYGCVEQISSAAFPQLFLEDLTTLSPARKTETTQNIIAAINKLRQFQTATGAMSYWPGGRYASEWGTTYAWHFMLLAEQRGYLIPSQLKDKWLNWQYQTASDYSTLERGNRDYQASTLDQAYRLYTLALASRPNLSAMNRLRQNTELPLTTRWRLAAAYLLAGIPEAATELTQNNSEIQITPYAPGGITFGSALRDKAMILEVLAMMDKEEMAFDLATNIANDLKQGDLQSTQTTAFALYAMARFAKGTSIARENHFQLQMNGKVEEISSQLPVYSLPLAVDENQSQSLSIKNLAQNKLYITTTITGKPLQGNMEDGSQNMEMGVKYQNSDGSNLDITKLKQGTDFKAIVTIKNPGMMGDYENLALAQIFPSGWEILNTRYTTEENEEDRNNYDYRDIRDDRVFTFFDLGAGKRLTFSVSLNAAYSGKFYMPGTSCQAMYNNKIEAHQAGKMVEVIR